MNERRHFHVLVVEDEIAVRLVIGRFVQAALKGQVKVSLADGLVEAGRLDLKDVDLIICDMTLGYNENGFDLLRHMRAAGIETPFMLMTGYSPERVAENMRPGEKFSNFNLIYKPLKSIADFREKLEAALALTALS